ncbi:hypothetical protein ENUP19_0051G0052 [Entamoeba nuttalli]|uniref:Uncharacterized protein n=2 Tax=Entamoeba nuttalli TaxID=412467 RepID=K2GSU1_ENTNP|nr:hypothetical protein ENU1_177780 [Entamoeba nuttalli P19]EKE38058.1 hypothetical protein ENU1_177780 [Entamoeba nuttalli P19]|eukprot:XP_008859605.1 hypothetical protein ENU1_177780 [Entamoeba nuttalli P19]
MQRMDKDDLADYLKVNHLEQLSVQTLFDYHSSVGEIKDYCEDLLECFKKEHIYCDEDIRYNDLCAKETEILEDMHIVLNKIIKEHQGTIKAIRRNAAERREELKAIKVKKEK